MSDHTDGIKATARRTLEEIFPNGDVAAPAEVVHPDVVNHEAPPGAPQGLDGMTQTTLRLKGAVSDHCTFSGRHTGEFMGLAPTNRPFAVHQVHIARFQDGKAIEHWAVRDDLAMLRQLGVIPSGAA